MNEPDPKETRYLPRVRKHLVGRVVAGILVLVPFVVTFLVLRFVLGVIASVVYPVADLIVPAGIPRPVVLVLSLVVLVIVLYIIGTVTAHSLGRRLLGFTETIFMRIPFLKVIFVSVKSAASALSKSEGSSFQSVVLLQFPKDGMWSLGFVTGNVRGSDGCEYLKIFVPTSPNPTSGFFELVRKTEVVQTDLTVEQGIESLVSGGILFPDSVALRQG